MSYSPVGYYITVLSVMFLVRLQHDVANCKALHSRYSASMCERHKKQETGSLLEGKDQAPNQDSEKAVGGGWWVVGLKKKQGNSPKVSNALPPLLM